MTQAQQTKLDEIVADAAERGRRIVGRGEWSDGRPYVSVRASARTTYCHTVAPDGSVSTTSSVKQRRRRSAPPPRRAPLVRQNDGLNDLRELLRFD